jgi:energy-coupling factor transporter ATP-binding protein EcfA2
MGELIGITGAIGSGKTTFADFLGQTVQNHAVYETNGPIIEVANRFNQLLEAELNFETTDDTTEMVNQVLIWMPDVIAEHLHHDATWTHIAITAKDTRAHPELYEKLFIYLKRVHADHTLTEKTITTDNKHDYRDLLQWLGGYFVAKLSPTIWYDELFRRVELHESFRSLVIIGGLRYISDAAVVREHGGRVLRVTRPGQEGGSTDVTEAERDQIEADITVVNNGSLAQLQALAETVWNDIAAGTPKKTYHAA